jgi:uncharacterized protein YndB with AHSA1/START domain
MTAPSDAKPSADRELSLTRIIDAQPEFVFKVWTDPAQVTHWWGPRGMTTPVCEMDLRPGGIFRTVMRAPDGTEYPTQGVFLEIAAPDRIVFTDAFLPGWQPSERAFMTAITTFEEFEGKTKYTARALHWSEADREAHEKMGFHEGWGESADRFVELVMQLKGESR